MAVLIETSQGDIVIDLYTEERPKCSFNFLKLCKVKYYNFSLVHTVQRHSIIQTGDPTGEGEGGECIWGVIKGEDYRFFEAETTPRLKHGKVGLVSMVNNGHDHHGSQFIITTGENLDYLDGKHTVFGEVAEGWDVLMKINEAYCDKEGRPYQDIRIYHTVVLEDPYDDPEGMLLPDRSPSPPKVVTDSNRIGAEEDVDDFKGKSEEEVREIVGKREMKANAQILEMVGDIPDAEGKPPENVLFVCKLNQATTAEDLEIIFSRFGAILSCEVIKDQKTGDSLQYAFIEFENEEDCINAYFKMDNVLIDDRRIHVDFSQSLAKVKGIRKRKYSEEKHGDAREGDGFVSKQPSGGGEGQYEMLFDEAEVAKSSRKKKTKQESSDSETRPKERDREKRRKDERRERERNDERRGKDERREKERGDHDRRRHHSSRDGERSRDRRRGEDSRHKRRRSRSHSRERYHKQSRDRSRSHSRERRRRH